MKYKMLEFFSVIEGYSEMLKCVRKIFSSCLVVFLFFRNFINIFLGYKDFNKVFYFSVFIY